MDVIRRPSPWEHLRVHDDQELLGWLDFYRNIEMPNWTKKLEFAEGVCRHNRYSVPAQRRLRDITKDYNRTRQMLNGLESEAKRRKLIP